MGGRDGGWASVVPQAGGTGAAPGQRSRDVAGQVCAGCVGFRDKRVVWAAALLFTAAPGCVG